MNHLLLVRRTTISCIGRSPSSAASSSSAARLVRTRKSCTTIRSLSVMSNGNINCSASHRNTLNDRQISSILSPTLSQQQQRYYNKSSFVLSDYPPHTLYPMPALSPTMETGTISEWHKQEGDEFTAGDVLCSIETDKATVDFEAQDDGIIAKIIKEGKDAVDLSVGVPICVVVEDEDDVGAFKDFTVAEDTTAAAAIPEADVAPAEAVVASTADSSGEGGRTPSIQFLGKDGWARRRAGEELPEVVTQVATSAPPAAAATAPPTAPSSPKAAISVDIPSVDTLGTYEDVANNNMRKIIAKRLTESKRDVPHFYTSVEVELDEVMKYRKIWKNKHDVKVSVNDIIIKASALALRDVPEVNSSYDIKSQTLKTNSTIDISVAVATPTGLITPIVPQTDTLGLSAITDKVRDLATRARDGKLSPEEYQGGTFTISNLGMFGINEFSAVINPPQAAILAIGGGTKTIVPTPYDPSKEVQDKPSIRTIMTARLSADRRVVDEATTSLFLSAFKYYMNKPELLLL